MYIKKKKLTKKFLLNNYIKKKKSTTDIAKMTKRVASSIHYNLEKFGIKKRTREEGIRLVGGKISKKMKGRIFSKQHLTRHQKAMEQFRKTEWQAIKDGSIYQWKKWKTFKEKIMKQDNYKCVVCGKKANTIHHKKKKEKFPELCWRRRNVISVCQSCHTKIDNPNSPKNNTQIRMIRSLKAKELQLKKQITYYKSKSLIDDLTKIYNYRKLHRDIKKYKAKQKRYSINYLIVLIDIDHFKKFNDKFGHKFGDKILIKTAKILKNSIRQGDNVYREYRGDEFVLILSHSKKEDIHILNRIRKELKKHDIKISIGYNELCENVLEIADKKMYNEKRRKK